MRDVLVEKLRFEMSKNYQCLLLRKDRDESLVICLYIDDTLVIAKQDAIERFKKEIRIYFEMSEYVGFMVCRRMRNYICIKPT